MVGILSSSGRNPNVQLDMQVSVCRELAPSSPRNLNTELLRQIKSGVQHGEGREGPGATVGEFAELLDLRVPEPEALAPARHRALELVDREALLP